MIHHLKRFKKTLTSLAACTLTLDKKSEHGAFGQTFPNDRIVRVRPTQLIGLSRISRIFRFRNRSRAADTNTGQRVPICSHIVEQVIPRSHDLPVHLYTRNTLPKVQNRRFSSLCTPDPTLRGLRSGETKQEPKR